MSTHHSVYATPPAQDHDEQTFYTAPIRTNKRSTTPPTWSARSNVAPLVFLPRPGTSLTTVGANMARKAADNGEVAYMPHSKSLQLGCITNKEDCEHDYAICLPQFIPGGLYA
ncbi:hypothetical protein Slin14017_G126870 [Septoria linicola]|nr:hypothetical protein Slin14017_G126870 [Septoria linicola]